MRTIIFPFKMGSGSAKDLAIGLGTKRVFHNGKYHPKDDDLIINWGNSKNPAWFGKKILNPPKFVSNAVNKLTTFEMLKNAGVPTVEFTTDREVAKNWDEVIIRGKVNGT